MRTLYEASNSLEAHMILNLLEMQGLSGRVDGEFLQGGIGELPAAGLVRLMVIEEDYPAAKEIVNRWEAAQPAPLVPSTLSSRNSQLLVFLVRMAIGFIAAGIIGYAYFGQGKEIDGIDHDRDGTLDEKWAFSRSGDLLRTETDRNLDKKIDYIVTYSRGGGAAEGVDHDDDFDGRFESKTLFKRGNPLLLQVDSDGDGYYEFKENYINGVLISAEYINPYSGYPKKIEYFRLGKMVYYEIDEDDDRKMDKRVNYDSLGEVQSTESLY